MLLRGILCPLGFDMIEALNGREALDKATEHHPDLILIDLVMPVMDGFEATRRIRQIPALKHTIVIAVSASVFEQTKEQSVAAGCDDYLPKPFEIDELLLQLQVHLKLEWIYKGTDEFSEKQAIQEQQPLIPPSKDALTRLFNLAMMGDVESPQEQAQGLATGESALAPFSSKIAQLAQELLIDDIQEFLARYMEEK